MRKLAEKTFKFPKGSAVSTITMRETNGIDEQAAALQADARGERSTIYAELVRLSVVAVDGKPVIQPFVELEQWTSVMRALVNDGYTHLNDLKEADKIAFLLGVEDEVAAPDEVPVASGEIQSLEEARSRTIAK